MQYFCQMNKALFFLLLTLSACGTKQQQPEQTQSKKEETRFFDVRHYITTDLEDIKKTPYYIYKLDIVNGKKDSTTVTAAEAADFANGFLTPDINDPAIKQYYKENIFQDRTINSFTITYTTTNKDLEIQNLDVLLKEDGSTVKRLFIRKFLNENDTARMEQWSWKPGESFEVNRLITPENKQEISHRTIIVWNEK
jgi:hypothetical protein